MTSQQIANEARLAYLKQLNEYAGAYRPDAPDLTAIILTAAARIVAESGAVEALAHARQIAELPQDIKQLDAALAALRTHSQP